MRGRNAALRASAAAVAEALAADCSGDIGLVVLEDIAGEVVNRVECNVYVGGFVWLCVWCRVVCDARVAEGLEELQNREIARSSTVESLLFSKCGRMFEAVVWYVCS